jgi:membrane protease YdiL (CAAX protease family)
LNSFPENPAPLETSPESSTTADAGPLELAVPVAPADPVWNGWDVLRIFVIGIVCLFSSVLAMLVVVSGTGLKARMGRLSSAPELLVLAQMMSYLLLLGYMYVVVTRERRSPRFWKAIHWNWPASISWYLVTGIVLQIVLLLLGFVIGRFVPFPRDTPFDALLRRPYTILLIAVFAMTLGPLMEELFFRGFLYPVLARRFGMSGAIATTALGFGLLHAAQYGYSYASVALIFCVGLALGTVRAKKDSVAAGFLVHTAYNGTIMMIMFIATDGFRHLEKLNQ